MLICMYGTCNDSQWREKLEKKLDSYKQIELFNPVVSDWNEEAQKNEIRMRKKADIMLYVITPKMTGAFSIAEVVDDSNKIPKKTIFCWLPTDEDDEFTKTQMKSLEQVGKLVEKNGAKYFGSLKEVIEYIKEIVDVNENVKIMKEVK